MYTSYTCTILLYEHTNITVSYDLTWVWLKLIAIIPGSKTIQYLVAGRKKKL